MAANSGQTSVFKVSTTDGSYNTVALTKSASAKMARDMLDITALGGTGPAALAGLKRFEASIDVAWDDTDTNGQAILQTAVNAGSAVWVQYLWDGTNGVKCQTLVESIAFKASPEGLSEASVSFKANGAWALV